MDPRDLAQPRNSLALQKAIANGQRMAICRRAYGHRLQVRQLLCLAVSTPNLYLGIADPSLGRPWFPAGTFAVLHCKGVGVSSTPLRASGLGG